MKKAKEFEETFLKGQTENIPELIHQIKNQFGEIKNIHWNAFHDIEGDLLTLNPFDLTKSFHLRVSSYIATVQACMDDLKAAGIENFIHVRVNVLDTLKEFNAKLLK